MRSTLWVAGSLLLAAGSLLSSLWSVVTCSNSLFGTLSAVALAALSAVRTTGDLTGNTMSRSHTRRATTSPWFHSGRCGLEARSLERWRGCLHPCRCGRLSLLGIEVLHCARRVRVYHSLRTSSSSVRHGCHHQGASELAAADHDGHRQR